MRDTVSVAGDALRAVLHQRWCDLSVPDLDGVLVELTGVAFAVAEATERVERALFVADKLGGLHLDAHGQQRHESPHEALISARSDLRYGAAAAREASRWLDDARQVTATVGLVFDQGDDHGIEEEY